MVGAAETRAAATEGRRCRNCRAVLTGAYCADCGQRDQPPNPRLADILADAWDTLTNIDGKVVASLRLLMTRPGALTTEYVEGRRVRYLPPFRLYLLCSVAFFLLNSADKPGEGSASAERELQIRTGGAAIQVVRNDTVQEPTVGLANPETPFEKRIDAGFKRVREESGRTVRETVMRQVPNVMFVLMPLYAAILQLLYWRRRMRFPLHVVFALHAHAFFFAALTLGELGEYFVDLVDTVLGLAIFGWVVAYFPLAMRRVYGGRWPATIARAALLAAVYGFAALAVAIAGVFAFLYVMGG